MWDGAGRGGRGRACFLNAWYTISRRKPTFGHHFFILYRIFLAILIFFLLASVHFLFSGLTKYCTVLGREASPVCCSSGFGCGGKNARRLTLLVIRRSVHQRKATLIIFLVTEANHRTSCHGVCVEVQEPKGVRVVTACVVHQERGTRPAHFNICRKGSQNHMETDQKSPKFNNISYNELNVVKRLFTSIILVLYSVRGFYGVLTTPSMPRKWWW